MFNVLILCTGNSARSVMGEAILNRRAEGRFRAFSAGSKPAGAVNPVGAKLLSAMKYDITAYSSKSWDVFSGRNAPQMDLVITVCDNAAGEACPVWPGSPLTVHWGFPDPAGVIGTEAEKLSAFEDVYKMIDPFMEKLVALPVEDMSVAELKIALQNIAERQG